MRVGPLDPSHRLPLPGDVEIAPGLYLNREQDILSIGTEAGDVTIHPASQLVALLTTNAPIPVDSEEVIVEPCPGCGQSIRWFRMEASAERVTWFPVDREPSLGGTIVATGWRSARMVLPTDGGQSITYSPHQVGCEYMRDQTRREAGPKGR